jgi:LysR family nitrogen assimilation transcriptional regulator
VQIAQAITRRVPGFEMDCVPDFRQAIADSWPRSIDDAPARADWGWRPATTSMRWSTTCWTTCGLPRARVTVVDGLSAHIAEWIGSGRADLGLVYNPEPSAALEITPLLREPLSLVQPVRRGRKAPPPTVALSELGSYPLILPERHQSLRRLLQTQATLAGVALDVHCEVSSIPTIIDLVCAGMGNAVLNASAVAASGRASELVVRRIVEPELPSVLCLAQSASKPPTPLTREARALLEQLVAAIPSAPARRPARRA